MNHFRPLMDKSFRTVFAFAAALALLLQPLGGPAQAAPSIQASIETRPLVYLPAVKPLSSVAPDLAAPPDPLNPATSWMLPIENTLLVYQKYNPTTYNFDLYIYNNQTFQFQPLVATPDDEIDPRFNHGCTKILYTVYPAKGGKYDLYTINPDGTGKQRLTQNQGNNLYGAWSRNGSRIAFTSDRDGQTEIYTMNADGSGQTRLTYSAGGPNYDLDEMPTWSPDGSKIAFISKRTGGYRVWVMGADGSNPTMLSSQAYSARPQWTPDGNYILYDAVADTSQATYTQSIFIMNADGSNQRLLNSNVTSTIFDFFMGSVSPDANVAAYTRIQFVYYKGNWYWENAANYYSSIQYGYMGSRLTPDDYDWSPSWETPLGQPHYIQFNFIPPVTTSPIPLAWRTTDHYFTGVNFELQYQDNGGAWTPLLDGSYQYTHETVFDGVGGHTYSFRLRTSDNFYNSLSWADAAQLTTTVENLPPVSSLDPIPPFNPGRWVNLSWTGSDPGGSGVAGYDIQVRDGPAGAWQNYLGGISDQQCTYTGVIGHTYYFRLRATDRAHNQESWTANPNGNGSTTLYAAIATGSVMDASGSPLAGVTPLYAPVPFYAPPSATDGSFVALFADASSSLAASFSRAGYGSPAPYEAPFTPRPWYNAYLPPADNQVANWDFESGAFAPADWTPGGETAPAIVTNQVHSGKYAARLGSPSSPANNTQDSDSSLSQVITVPPAAANPGLSFLYSLPYPNISSTGFSVQVSGPGLTQTVFSGSDTITGWSHVWIDLSPWAGQTVTLTFNLHQLAGHPTMSVYLDEVSVGSTYPDAWVQASSPVHANPGSQVTVRIDFGNHSRISAPNARLTLTLPAGLTFVSANINPTTIDPTLTWDVGSLAQQAGTLWVTLQVDPSVIPLTPLAYTAALTSDSTEIETANNTAPGVINTNLQVYLPMLKK